MLGRSERGAEAIAEAIKIHDLGKNRVAPLDKECKGEYYFGVGGNFLGGPKNNQLLNATAEDFLSFL